MTPDSLRFCLCTPPPAEPGGGSPQRECTCRSRVHLTACRTPDAGNQEDRELAVSVVEQSTLKATCDTCQNVRKGRKERKNNLLLSMFCAHQRFWLFSGLISGDRWLLSGSNWKSGRFPGGKGLTPPWFRLPRGQNGSGASTLPVASEQSDSISSSDSHVQGSS